MIVPSISQSHQLKCTASPTAESSQWFTTLAYNKAQHLLKYQQLICQCLEFLNSQLPVPCAIKGIN